jgi:hypothetical protein
MKVFISYGAEGDQVTALRLQALAAVHGHSVYVPPAYTRQVDVATFDPDLASKLKDAEIVLGVIGEGLTEACRQELNSSVALRKNMIVMAYPWFVPQLQPHFGQVLVEIDPENPGAAEGSIVQHLKSIELQKNAKNVLLALGTLTLGLLILSPTDQN